MSNQYAERATAALGLIPADPLALAAQKDIPQRIRAAAKELAGANLRASAREKVQRAERLVESVEGAHASLKWVMLNQSVRDLLEAIADLTV